MDWITLAHFRASLYAAFAAVGDTLLNIVDALASETAAQSLPELSLSAFFPRKWSSLSQGLQTARIDRAALRQVFAAHAPRPLEGKRWVLGIDARSILRPFSQTAQDRAYVPSLEQTHRQMNRMAEVTTELSTRYATVCCISARKKNPPPHRESRR